MPTTTTSAPVMHIRVIGPAADATALLAHVAEQARRMLGPHTTCRTQTRTARRNGHVRAYLTVSRKDP